jgi:hypothetical protein
MIRHEEIALLLTAAISRLAIGDRHDSLTMLSLKAGRAQVPHREYHTLSPLVMSRVSIGCVCKMGSDHLYLRVEIGASGRDSRRGSD